MATKTQKDEEKKLTVPPHAREQTDRALAVNKSFTRPPKSP